MKLLIDECLGRRFALHLKRLNPSFEIALVADIAARAIDRDILSLGLTREEVVISSDNDFGELVFRDRVPFSAVVYLRLEDVPVRSRAEMVARFLAPKSWESILGTFTVIGPNSVRTSTPSELPGDADVSFD